MVLRSLPVEIKTAFIIQWYSHTKFEVRYYSLTNKFDSNLGEDRYDAKIATLKNFKTDISPFLQGFEKES